jgi:hypothetical protein
LAREEKNPALGKGRHFAKKLAWLPDSWKCTKELFLGRFYERFGGFLETSNALTYLPSFLGGIALPLPERISDEEYAQMIMKLPSVVRRTMDKVLGNTAEPRERNALWAFASNTTFRGINMRTLAEEQLQAVFTHFVDDSVKNSDLGETLGYEPERWESLRRRDRLRAAKAHGLISLSEAIQLFERPTYFKEVLAELSSVISEDPLNRQFKTAEREIRRICSDQDMTLVELEKCNPDLVGIYRKFRNLWFARQAEIETLAFTRVRGARKPSALADLRPADRGGFNTRTWSQRMTDLVGDLLLHSDATESTPEGDERIIQFACGARKTEPPPPDKDEVFIRRSRIVDSLCTLSTPLVPRNSWKLELPDPAVSAGGASATL